jgi:hypothetical protein
VAALCRDGAVKLAPRIVRSQLWLARAVASLRRRYLGRPRRGMVAMFHVGRCGSTVLASLLEQHSEIRWGGELFHEIEASTPGYQPTPAWVRTVIELSAHREVRDWFGFETKAIHCTAECLGTSVADYVSLLRELGFDHFVVLRRDNLLRVVVSALVGHRQRRWHTRATPMRPTRIVLDPVNPWGNGAGSLLDTFDAYEHFYRLLEQPLHGLPRLDLVYERDIEGDPLVAYRRTCEFLGLAPRVVNVPLARTNPFALDAIVSNFDAVVGTLRGTRFDWMLAK